MSDVVFGKKTVQDDSLIANWDELLDALVRRWPKEFPFVIADMSRQSGDSKVLTCLMRVPLWAQDTVSQLWIENDKELKEIQDKEKRAQSIARNLAKIFMYLAE